MPHVFERFQRPAMPGTARQSGLGLGLAIVKSVVEAHAGRVSLHSAGPGQGTTVRVQLPAEPLEAAGATPGRTVEGAGADDVTAAPRPAGAVPPAMTGPASSSRSEAGSEAGPGGVALDAAAGGGRPGAVAARPPGGAPAATAGEDRAAAGLASAAGTPGAAAAAADAPLTWRRILVLEDEADSLELLTVLLRRQGAIVRAFDNAEQALAAAEHSSFDLVISDLGLPGMDGLEFMRRLQRRPVPLKAIALTAYAGDRQREEALKAGFSRVETKPISPPEFLATVTAALAETRAVE
jgi:CheY-like chemotaxis protein